MRSSISPSLLKKASVATLPSIKSIKGHGKRSKMRESAAMHKTTAEGVNVKEVDMI